MKKIYSEIYNDILNTFLGFKSKFSNDNTYEQIANRYLVNKKLFDVARDRFKDMSDSEFEEYLDYIGYYDRYNILEKYSKGEYSYDDFMTLSPPVGYEEYLITKLITMDSEKVEETINLMRQIKLLDRKQYVKTRN